MDKQQSCTKAEEKKKKDPALLDHFQHRHLENLHARKRPRLSEGELRGEELPANIVSLDVDELRDQSQHTIR